MKGNAKKAKSAAAATTAAAAQQQQQQQQQPPSSSSNNWQSPSGNNLNNGMNTGTLPPPSMLLHTSDSLQQSLSSNSDSMNQYSDLFSSRPSSYASNNKTNKRKLDELADPSCSDFDSSSSSGGGGRDLLKPQKIEQFDSDEQSVEQALRFLMVAYLCHPPQHHLEMATIPVQHLQHSILVHRRTISAVLARPNPSLLTQQTPPPPPSLQQPPSQQQQPQPPSVYMPMSPRNQFTITSDSPFLQTNNQVFVFTTQLANDAAEAVLKNEQPNIIEFHKSLPGTAQYLASLSPGMNNSHNSLLGGPMHMNHGLPPPPGCHSPRTMQMMMGGPHHNPHHPHHNGGGGPPPNWPHPHFHPHHQQQQPPFGRLTPGGGGLPPPSHLLPPGALIMNGSPPPPGMRMGGMPPMPGAGPLPSDGIENLTPERAKHRKNQLNKIEDLKTKISGRSRAGSRAKNNAAAAAAAANASIPVNGGPPPPGSLDPHHQQQMMMLNSPHGVGPPHHMMGIGPPPPHMLPPGMRGPEGMMLDMNGPPPHGFMNGPPPPGFHGQFGPGPGDPFGPMPHQAQAVREWNKMQMEHLESKSQQQMRGQPPPYSSTSPSSLTPPIASTSSGLGGGPGGNLNNNSGKLLSPKLEPSSTPRLYKVGQPEKFMPDALPSSATKKLIGNVGEVQLTASPTQMDYQEFGMEGEELIITRHLNRAYRSSNGAGGGQPLSSSSACKDEPMTPMARSTSTPNNNNSLPPPHQLGQQQQPSGSTTPTHHSQGPPSHLTPQSVSAASPRPTKMTVANSNLSSPLMLSNNNSTAKDEPLDLNGGPKTPTSNMAPPLSSMLQMTNNLQSANSSYNPSSNTSNSNGPKPPSLSSSNIAGGPPLISPNLAHMAKTIDQLPPPTHMTLQQHQQHMQFQNMNPHHRMLGPPELMPSHFNPHHGHGGNLPPPHPHMYKMMSPHPSLDPSGMMLHHPGGPSRLSKQQPPPHPQSSDPMQQHLHHLPPGHYAKMHNMDPLLGPPPGHQQQHMRFSPMMDDAFGMGPPPPSHHPHSHHHPHMHHPHHHPQMLHHPQMHPNDGRPPQAINNTYVSATMSIQQLNIQSLGPGGPQSELQPGTIHYHASSGSSLDQQQQQQQQQQGPPPPGGMYVSQQQFTTMNNISTNDQSFAPQFNDLQQPPSNLSVDGGQPPSYW